MRKLVFLMITLFLVIFSFRGYAEPTWSGNLSSTPTNYSPNTFSEFNITWTNDVNMTFITITNSAGYVLVNNSSMSNLTYGENIYNFSIILPAGTFNWTSYANNSTNNWNSSGTWTFTIGLADNPVHLYLNNSIDQNKTYIYPQAINATSTATSGTVYLYRNESPVANGTSPINETILLGNGTYVYKVNATGNQNYSDNTTSLILHAFVNKGTIPINLYLNGNESNKSYSLNNITNFTVFLSLSDKMVYLSSNYTNFTTVNSSSSIILNYTNLSLPGLFNLTAYWNGDENYSASSTTYYFDNNFTPQYSITSALDNVYEYNKTYLFNISVTAATVDKVLFEYNGTNYTANGTSGSYWYPLRNLKAINYYFRWFINNSIGTSNSTPNTTYTVNKYPTVAILIISPNSINQGSSASVYCYNTTPHESLINLYRNSTPIGSGTNLANDTNTSSLSAGSYNYNCTIAESENYTIFTVSNYFLTVTSGAFIPINPPSGGGGDQPSGSFTITSSSSNVTMEPNTSKVITFTLRNTLSNGYITNINLTVSGLNASWYSLDKTNITRLRNDGGNETVQLTLNVPNDAERKNYAINFTASGKDFNLNKITRQTTITLTVPQAPQNATEETGNVTNATNATTNETAAGPTGLSIKPEDIRNIVLFIGLIAVGLVFLFRSNITEFLTGGLAHKVQTPKIEKAKEESKEKKASVFSSVKNKLCKLNDRKLVIQVKKKDKEKA
jgi:hypothetical protein